MGKNGPVPTESKCGHEALGPGRILQTASGGEDLTPGKTFTYVDQVRFANTKLSRLVDDLQKGSFRTLFNLYFGTQYRLLADETRDSSLKGAFDDTAE